MSYVFDSLCRHFKERFVPRSRDEFEQSLFEMILQEIHCVNHRLNDAINRDSNVRILLKEYEDYIEKGGSIV